MAEIVDCPGCKRKLQVPNDVIGQRVQCPTCAAVFVAGAAPTAAPPLPPYRDEERPEDDFDDLPTRSRPRRRRFSDDEDYDDEPRSRRRRRDLEPHRADMILVLGILSVIVCPLVFGQLAWFMGSSDLAEMDAGRMDPSGRSNTNIGRIIGIVSTCLLAIPAFFGCFFFLLAGILAAGR